MWSLGYHRTADDIGGSLTVSFDPLSRTLQVFNAFLQDEIALVPKRWYFTAGTKFEHNDYTGFEIMPSIRLAFRPTEQHMAWAAVSRALRAPSRNDTNLIVNLGSFIDENGVLNTIRFSGDPRFEDEVLTAYELGYRTAVAERLSIDVTAYFNDYDKLQSIEAGIPFPEATPLPLHIVLPIGYANGMSGETHGLEVALDWQVTNRWILDSAACNPDRSRAASTPR